MHRGESTHEQEWGSLISEMEQAIMNTELVALTRRKRTLSQHLGLKTSDMTLRLQIMRLKYAVYQRYMDWFNIAIIVISTTTAVTEAVKGELGLNDVAKTAPPTYHFMQLLPVFTSTATAFLASIVKFKKYAEKLEGLGRTIEKTISTTARVNRIVDQITALRTLEEVEDTESVVTEVLESVLQYTDVVRYMPTYHTLALSHLRSERQFEEQTTQVRSGEWDARAAGTGLRTSHCTPRRGACSACSTACSRACVIL